LSRVCVDLAAMGGSRLRLARLVAGRTGARGGPRASDARGHAQGLAVTGGVITSAGIVLAGTFAVLAVLPLVALTQIGITVAFGVLLDTFVVRSLLVPALTFELGERVWWPSALGRRLRKTAARTGLTEAAEPAVHGSAE